MSGIIAVVFSALLWSFVAARNGVPKSPPFYPSPLIGRTPEEGSWTQAIERARGLVSQMDLVEKVNLTTGIGASMGRCSGTTGSVPRLNVTGICLQDSPLGVGGTDLITSFPPGISMATSFNKDLISKRGRAMGKEFKKKGAEVQLGPVVGPIGSRPLGGRNWESFGSDAYLQGVAGALTVQGIQHEGIVANVKHLIGNEQETFRLSAVTKMLGGASIPESLSSNIDDRTMHELYLWPFADVIKAGAASLMCSYNQVNNSYGCQNSYVMNGLVKDELGFNGFIVSDWSATHAGAATILSGLDMTMPGDTGLAFGGGSIGGTGVSFYGANLTQLVLNGTVPEWRVNDMATRILAAYYYVGADKDYHEPNYSMNTKDDYGFEFGTEGYRLLNEHVNAQTGFSREVTHKGAVESFVLLRNENKTLPLKQNNKTSPQRLSILGLAAYPHVNGTNAALYDSRGALAQGWGSGAVNLPYMISPLEALNQRSAQEGISVQYTTGEDAVYADGEVLASTDFYNYAKHSDMNIIFGMSASGESLLPVYPNVFGDRVNYTLWHGAEELIEKAVKLNKNNVIVATTVGPINMEKWINHPNVSAVLLNTPTGQDFGTALTEILFGDENPSGRLPFTIAKNDKDYIPLITTWDNTSNIAPQEDFREGVYIDYKHFDKYNITPRFEFGYGLSYTSFNLSGLKVEAKDVPEDLPQAQKLKPIANGTYTGNASTEGVTTPDGFHKIKGVMYPWLDSLDDAKPHGKYPFPEGHSANHSNETHWKTASGGPGGNPELYKNVVKVTAKVSNTGNYSGQHVAQLYLGLPKSNKFPSPERQLRGFEKVNLTAGGSSSVEFNLRVKDLAVWDTDAQTWKIQRGDYTVYVGSSSRNLELQDKFTL